jgi:uncharacterized protein (TIGR02646 family)
MHHLDRSRVPYPSCLDEHDPRTQTWKDLGKPCGEEVRYALEQLQSAEPGSLPSGSPLPAPGLHPVLCAYCETEIHPGSGHIEHFRRKSRTRPDGFPELTFDWDNLFLSCVSHEHCGHYKDRRNAEPYDPDELVKPDEHNPDDLFFFVGSTGNVEVRSDRPAMTESERRRAEETVRVFNLNHGALCAARRRAVRSYHRSEELLEVLRSLSAAQLADWLHTEKTAAQGKPHCTAIRHYLQSHHPR